MLPADLPDKNVKESSLDKRKKTAERKLDLLKRMKNTEN